MKILKALAVIMFFATPAKAQFLGEKTYDIEAITVTARGEDRAYRIMRNAIARAPHYRDQVAAYNAEVYLKGSVDVVKISSIVKAMGGEDFRKEVKEGDNFTDESVSEIDFSAPRTYRQRVIKQISNSPSDSGGAQAEAQAMRMLNLNIYDHESEVFLAGLIISPLSPGAFNHYKFVYEGYVELGDRIINKIRVIPRRHSQQLVQGYLYIAEDHWNVHEIDLAGHMNLIAGIDFRLEANYDEAMAGVWMPENYRMAFDISVVGSKFAANYVASAKYNSLTESSALSKGDFSTTSPSASAEGTPPYQGGEISHAQAHVEPFTLAPPEKKLTNHAAYRLARRADRKIAASKKNKYDLTEELSRDYKVTVDSLANESDPEFWDSHRPVALTASELEGYRNRGVSATKEADTTARRETSTLTKMLMGTGSKPIKLGAKGGELLWRGLLSLNGGFNTVDGYYLGWTPVVYRKNFSGKADLTITPEAIWAINRHVGLGSLKTQLRYAPMRRGEFTLNAGSLSRDFHSEGGIRPIENTIASLFFRRNYMKLYQDNFVAATNTIDLANGLALTLSAKFARRLGLENSTGHSYFYREKRVYTPNITIPNHNALTVAAKVTYTPAQYYRVINGRKVPVRSAWPTFFAEWRKGVSGVLGSSTDFDHIGGGVTQSISPGMGHGLTYMVRGGVFVNRNAMSFPDFHHFDTADIPLLNTSIVGGEVFKLLPYYRFSTDDRYIQAHIAYSARFLILKLLPWFSNRLWQEGLQANYLSTPTLKHYTEVGYTIGLWWQAGVFVGFEGAKFRSWGAKLAIPIQFNMDSDSIDISL
jgi:hypothetical protein